MPSLFPGMDPYLEQPAFWSAFHNRLIVAIADALAPQLRPSYYVEIETRTYSDSSEGGLLVGIPDAVVLAGSETATKQRLFRAQPQEVQPQTVTLPTPIEIKERYLEIREVGSNAVITVLEVLSPKNKRPGEGRSRYEEKRQQILASAFHLVEIDLLRGGLPMPMQGATTAHYRILVSRAEQRPKALLYAVNLPEPLPEFPLPLRSPDEEIPVDLQSLFTGVYDRASYDLRVDYTQPLPALSREEQAWISAQLASDL